MPYVPRDGSVNGVPHVPDTADTHYRWINSMNRIKFGQWLVRHGSRPGYGIVQGATVEDTKKLADEMEAAGAQINSSFVDASNRVTYGEMVLVSIPRGEHERRREELVREQRTIAADFYKRKAEELNETVESRHVRAFAAEKEEIDDRKRFATREDRPFVSQHVPGA